MKPIVRPINPYTKWFWHIALSLITLSVAVVLYWLYSPPTEAIILKQPIPILSKSVKAGEYVLLDLNYCKNVRATGRVTTTLVSDKAQLVLPTGYDSGPKLCQHFRAPLPIPPQATPDTYHFHFRSFYQINPLQSITQDYDTESFKVE